ncbi:MAG: nucleotide sugar dehydrogenase [Elusimicrobia bacterium]|nr:MAG: nucleotide sugar dehydrogenase [Elusimicrobiota bacterium]
MFEYDVCIVGTGRVGLPLALSFIESGSKVTGVDIDENLRNAVNNGTMPFHEPGYETLIASKQLVVHESPNEVVPKSAVLVITVGTPLHNHIETDLSQIQNVLEELGPHIREGQLIILRSTVAPGTTSYVKKWLERNTSFKVGENLLLSFCPERTAEGVAHKELRSLPQICGAEDTASRDAAGELFAKLAPEIMKTNFITAELVKLFNNISRYINFAVANQFALIADNFDANIYETRRLANHNYPRCNLAMPGFTGGTCLRKDFGMLNEWSPYPDMLLSAWKMNEFTPAMLVEQLMKRTKIHDSKVAVLGFTFKQDTDDIRDSLVPKLCRYIQRQLPLELRVSDHHLPDPIPEPSAPKPLKNWEIADALDGIDCVFVATNHKGYKDALLELGQKRPEAWIADIWNVGETDQIYYQAGRMAGAKTAA